MVLSGILRPTSEGPLLDVAEQDFGATGQAALSRPHTISTVHDGQFSKFRDHGVQVRRYHVTQLDSLRAARKITYSQWCAARHATALFRGAALQGCVTSRYAEWVSGARGRWVSTDDGEDEAAPWRELLSTLPPGPAQALEALVLNCAEERHMSRLVEALDRVARDIGA